MISTLTISRPQNIWKHAEAMLETRVLRVLIWIEISETFITSLIVKSNMI